MSSAWLFGGSRLLFLLLWSVWLSTSLDSIRSLSNRNAISNTCTRSFVESKLEVFESRLHQALLMVVLLALPKGLLHGSFLFANDQVFITRLVLTLVDEPTSMDHVPWLLLVIVLALELGLLGGTTHRNLLEVDSEWILAWSEGIRSGNVNHGHHWTHYEAVALFLLTSSLRLFWGDWCDSFLDLLLLLLFLLWFLLLLSLLRLESREITNLLDITLRCSL